MHRICFYCDKEILSTDSKFMYPIEVPYCNLWFHRDCYILIRDEMPQFLSNNYNKIVDYTSKKK